MEKGGRGIPSYEYWHEGLARLLQGVKAESIIPNLANYLCGYTVRCTDFKSVFHLAGKTDLCLISFVIPLEPLNATCASNG